MTGRPVPDPAGVDWVLRICCGQHTRPWTPGTGRWLVHPTADYRCPACGFTDSASGEAAVRAFVATIRSVHAPNCTRKETNQ